MTNHLKSAFKTNQKVAILVEDNVALFELGCAVEMFALSRPEIENWYKTDVVSFSNGLKEATGGVQIQVKTVTDLDQYELLIIPCWPINKPVSDNISSAVLKLYERGGRVISFCSGAFLLAEVGLLVGKKAITHWRYAEEFKKRFTQTIYVEDVLYIYDNRIGCSAGSSAAIDLGIEVIRVDYGYKVANQVARRLVMAAHRNGGQSQFVDSPIPKQTNTFSATLDWAIANINNKLDVKQLASQAHMTRRTFDRKFRETLNMAPKEWLIQQRVERAKQLLETTSQNIDQIAVNSGFETAMTMRHNFRKAIKLTPSQFRQQFAERK